MILYDNPLARLLTQSPNCHQLSFFSSELKAEQLGYDSLSVNDHIVFNTSWLDSICTLSAVAGVTTKIKLGTSILNIVIRNPVICSRALSSIDILSSGRLFAAGVGPGSHKGDYAPCGIPFEEMEEIYRGSTGHKYALE